MVAGVLLIIIGLGLFFTNKSRISEFEAAYNEDPSVFVELEITRAEATLKEYNTIVFKAIPIIIILAALLIIFINTPTWRAISITTIAMLIVILLVDGTAYARIDGYHKELKLEKLGKKIIIKNLVEIHGTPILDIKPVMEEFQPQEKIRQPEWIKEIMKNYWTT
ncbi:MAG: hypothetical protein BalsKO_08970 [Balneolaceae bacterium]